MRKFVIATLGALLVASGAQAIDLCLINECGKDDGKDDGKFGKNEPVPEPGAALAFVTGLVALGASRRRARKS